MALIPCPECGKEISPAAAVCIGCGHPMRSDAPVATPGTPAAPIVIEQTSKEFKRGMVLGIAMVAVFLMLAFMTMSVPKLAGFFLLCAFMGVVVFIGSIIGAWWNHS